jgi:hypothetical protein
MPRFLEASVTPSLALKLMDVLYATWKNIPLGKYFTRDFRDQHLPPPTPRCGGPLPITAAGLSGAGQNVSYWPSVKTLRGITAPRILRLVVTLTAKKRKNSSSARCCDQIRFRFHTAASRRETGAPPPGAPIHRHLLLALSSMPVQSVEQRRVCARQLIGLVQVLPSALECLLRDHRASIAFHRSVVRGEELRGHHRLAAHVGWNAWRAHSSPAHRTLAATVRSTTTSMTIRSSRTSSFERAIVPPCRLDSILKNVKQDDSNYKQDDSSY